MNYQQALASIKEEFDEWGYSTTMMASRSRDLHLLKSEKYGLHKCTGEWPMGFTPTPEDLNATDWNIVTTTKEY